MNQRLEPQAQSYTTPCTSNHLSVQLMLYITQQTRLFTPVWIVLGITEYVGIWIGFDLGPNAAFVSNGVEKSGKSELDARIFLMVRDAR